MEKDNNKVKDELCLKDITSKYRKLQHDLLSIVKGQDEAIEKICKVLFNSELLKKGNDESSKSPYAVFFMFGAPGTGKTFTVENIANLLNYPWKKFDMTSYSYEGDQIGLVGSDRQFRNAKEGELTTFIGKNEETPHIVIFDEIEKAHKQTLDILLSILGSGELSDPYRRLSISTRNTIIFFTSNSGKDLYKDNSDVSNITTTTLLDALEKDVDINGKRRLSEEFCSRIVSGNPIIFNNLKLHNLIEISNNVLKKVKDELHDTRKIKLSSDKNLALLFLYMSGSKDARIISKRFESFVKDNLFRIPFEKYVISNIDFEIDYKTMPKEILDLFVNDKKYKVVYIGNNEKAINSLSKKDFDVIKVTDSDVLKEALRSHIDLVIVDPLFGGVKDKLISITDYNSKGINLFYELMEIDSSIATYILTDNKSMINDTDKQSLIKDGARELICNDEINKLNKKIIDLCRYVYIEKNINKLTSKGWILDCKNMLVVNKSEHKVSIVLNKFRKYMDYDSDALKIMVKDSDKPDVLFSDIIGAQNAKDELKYFIDYLKDPLSDKNRKLKTPKGILLYGPAGTGKTMLAKAMANEAGVNYISLNGSDLVCDVPSLGIKKIEDIFSSAKKYAPSVIFIDEIDAIAKRRIGNSDEVVLNALLTQMDGFKTNVRKPVFVLAATNFPIVSSDNMRSIDPALLRRFDLQLYIGLPNKKERIQFVDSYLKNKKNIKLDKSIINSFGECSVSSSLAQIENIIELAVRKSIRENSDLTGNDLLEAIDEYYDGQKHERKKTEAYSTAIHEAGHAIISSLCNDVPTYITIESRYNYGGYVKMGDGQKDKHTRSDLINNIRCCLAGRISEKVFFGEDGINSGAGNDLKKATDTAKLIVNTYGMNGRLAVYDDILSSEQMEEIEAILQDEYKNTLMLVKENKKKIKLVADALIDRNHLTKKEFLELIK